MIEATILPKLIITGESETLEFKASFNDEAIETLGAFMNANGGILLLGVKDSGSICGFDIGKKHWKILPIEFKKQLILASNLLYQQFTMNIKLWVQFLLHLQ